ncbi:C-C motif chemokine 27-like [Scyliorhinus canicula]|uniref:C-C motif chemokine 27-like n=1 Tax=Scyliorhinus canicula TaxID=7830 RepID=UPI0018F47B24|nr:C-C motif chemokine 27-like [Scyliorhinus canicula]
MELKVAALLLISVTALLHMAAAMHPTQIVSCCTEVAKKIHPRILTNVKSFEKQHDHVCAIKAVLVHKSRRTFCLDPNNTRLQRWMEKNHNKEINARK